MDNIFEIICFFLVAAMWWKAIFMYLDHKTDSLRHRLFVLRDDLFDYAAMGNMDFNNPAYYMTRMKLNGLIRFAHEMSFFRLVVSTLLFRLSPKARGLYIERYRNYTSLVERLPDSQKQKVFNILREADKAILISIVWKSPILAPLMMLLRIAFLASRHLKRLVLKWSHHRAETTLKAIDAEANDLGHFYSPKAS